MFFPGIASNPVFATGKYFWNIILIKDFLVAAPFLSLIVATSCGYWNTCYCWGGGPVHGDKTQVPLNPANIFNFNDDTFYPAVVGVGLGLQVVVFLMMLGIGWDGFRFLGPRIPCPNGLIWLWKKAVGFKRSPLVVDIEPERELRELSYMDMRGGGEGGTEITYLQVSDGSMHKGAYLRIKHFHPLYVLCRLPKIPIAYFLDNSVGI